MTQLRPPAQRRTGLLGEVPTADGGPVRLAARATSSATTPIDRLALAVRQPNLTTAVAEQPAKIEEFRRYVPSHTSAIDPQTGARWAVTVNGFGLMHGLAFAALLGQLDLGRGSIVADLLGFNLGIEVNQLMGSPCSCRR